MTMTETETRPAVEPGKARLLHTMLRVKDLDKSLHFYTELLGMKLLRKRDYPTGKFTLAFVGYGDETDSTVIELTHNWDVPEEGYGEGRNFGHLAYEVDDIYATCDSLMKQGITINRPPRDGQMAFVRSPDLHSIELLQKGDALPPKEPWSSMPNTGHW